MSGSGRSTTTAVLHRGHQYAPDAPHQPRSHSQWLAGVMMDSGMRSPKGDVEWDVGGGEEDLEECGITPAAWCTTGGR